MKRPCVLVTAFCLATAPACKKDPEPAPATDASKATPSAPSDPTKAAPKPEGTPPSAPPTGATPTPGAPPVLVPSYAAALDPLLELVPAGAEQFLVVRDLDEVLDDAQWLLTAEAAPILRIMELSPSPDETARKHVKDFASVRASFTTSGIDFTRGVVVVGNGAGSDVLLFASPDPEALNKLFGTLGGEKEQMKCKSLSDVAGFAACAEKDDGTLDKYAAGKAAGTLRTELGKALPGVDLEEANFLGRWRGGDGPDAIAISTAPGLFEVHVATELDDEFEKATAAGPAPALALAPKGGSFVWGRLDTAFLTSKAGEAPAIVGNVVKTMTGEYFFGALADPGGLAAVLGVTDAGPGAALVPMFSFVQDQLPKTLPDGTALKVAVEPIDVGTGTSVQTVHAVATSPDTELIAKAGLVPEGLAFVAGKYAAAVVGADTKAVASLAKFDPSGAAPVLDVLPADMATALRDGKAVMAVQLELDGLQNATLRELITKAAERLPPSDPGQPAPGKLIELGLAVAASFSSISVWVTRDGGPSIVHVAVRSFGDPKSDEGKAAHAAVAEVDAGTRDAKTVYGELAGKYPDSPRAFAYRMRSETSASAVTPAFSGLLLGGVLASFVLLRQGPRDAPAVSAVPAEPAKPVEAK